MKVALHGIGKMGRAVEKIAIERGHEIVARISHDEGGAGPSIGGADVLIDFSHYDAISELVDLACSWKTNLVIGTTGWNERMDSIKIRCEKAGIGIVYAANFSPGANIMFALTRHAASLFSRFPEYASGIEERHHARKKDAPSGTALRIRQEVAEGSNSRLEPPIASTRVGAEVGLHTVFFDSPDDLVEVTHRARSREGFARGAVIAAETLQGRKGFFRFDELMELI